MRLAQKRGLSVMANKRRIAANRIAILSKTCKSLFVRKFRRA